MRIKHQRFGGIKKTFYFFLSLILHENDIDRHYSYAIAVSFG